MVGEAEREHEVGDEFLVQRAQRGDAGAFTELVRRHDDRLRGLAFHLLGGGEVMDDVMQATYLNAFRALPGFAGRASIGTWLHRLTYNACVDELRRGTRRQHERPYDEIAEPTAPASADPGELVAGRTELHAALMTLPADERAAVWLVDAIGFDYSEAAEIMATPEGTIGSRLHRARAALRRVLEPPTGEVGR